MGITIYNLENVVFAIPAFKKCKSKYIFIDILCNTLLYLTHMMIQILSFMAPLIPCMDSWMMYYIIDVFKMFLNKLARGHGSNLIQTIIIVVVQHLLLKSRN